MKMSYKDNKIVQLLLSIVSLMLSGFVIMIGWNWYIHPLGVVTIGFVWALGIGLFVDFILYKEVLFKLQKDRLDKNGFDAITNNLSYTAITFLYMYLLHLFM